MGKSTFALGVVLLVHSLLCVASPNHEVLDDDFEALNETAEIHVTGKKSCNGPGSDPYRNLVFNGRCNCKKNVKGKFCTDCKRHSFGLSADHRHGCVRCFCSGLSTACESSDWFREKRAALMTDNLKEVDLVYRNLTSVQIPLEVDEVMDEMSVHNLPPDSLADYYWKLPSSFYGDQLSSYGGFLNFTINYVIYRIPKEERKWVKHPLAIISGKDITVYYRFRKRHRRIASHILPLVEQNWYKMEEPYECPEEDVGMCKEEDNKKKKGRKKKKRARRKEFMQMLTDIKYILLKANYRANVQSVSLKMVSMSYASPNGSLERATSVESCICPPGYGGLSCQRCSSGYTKNLSDLNKRKRSPNECVPCQCNGHSDTCDQESGKCLECKHQTRGDHCQYSLLKCDQRGTIEQISLPGEPSRCRCKARVQGELCDSCKEGYFDLDGEKQMGCTKCWCNGVTFSCKPSNLRRFQIKLQPPSFINFNAYHSNFRKYSRATQVTNGKASYRFKRGQKLHNPHWSLPKRFTGNLLKSYGGFLNFSTYQYSNQECNGNVITLVELESFDKMVLKWKFSPPTLTNSVLRVSVHLVEENFEIFGQRVGRPKFLEVLSAVESIRIYVPECAGLKVTEIEAINLDTAVSYVSEHPLASSVEECQCPPEYSGLSCENCSPGYVKDATRKRCTKKTFFN